MRVKTAFPLLGEIPCRTCRCCRGGVWPPQSPAATVKKHLWAFDELSNPPCWKDFWALLISDIVQLFAVQVYSTPCPLVNHWVQEHVQKCAAQRGHQQLTGDRRAGKSKPSGTRPEQGSLSASALQIDWFPGKCIDSVYSKATACFPFTLRLYDFLIFKSVHLPPSLQIGLLQRQSLLNNSSLLQKSIQEWPGCVDFCLKHLSCLC